ncbi:MAG: hypothetical protein ACKVX7_14095 [Planctomycetota bacterium]
MRKEFLLVLLGVSIGANAVFGASLLMKSDQLPTAYGGDSVTTGLFSTGTTRMGQAEKEAFWVFSHADLKLAVYELSGLGLTVHAVRDLQFDFKPRMFGKQTPTVEQMENDTKGPKEPK